MLPLSVNVASLAGLAGSAIIAMRISRQGEMHVQRLWLMPLATILVANGVHRPMDWSSFGEITLALGLAVGIGLGWMRARSTVESIDVANRRFVTKGSKFALLLVVGMGLLSLVLANIFMERMLRWINPFLVMGIASECTMRLWMYGSYLRARIEWTGSAARSN